MAETQKDNDLEIEQILSGLSGKTMGHYFEWWPELEGPICSRCGRFGEYRNVDQEGPFFAEEEDIKYNDTCLTARKQNLYPDDLERYLEWKKEQSHSRRSRSGSKTSSASNPRYGARARKPTLPL